MFFGDQFEDRLKKVDLEPQVSIEIIDYDKFANGFKVVIPNGMPNHRPVLLFDMGLVIFAIRSRTGESNLFLTAIAKQSRIDKFSAVIRIHPEKWKRKLATNQLDALRYRDLGLVRDGDTFCPTCGNIGGGQGI